MVPIHLQKLPRLSRGVFPMKRKSLVFLAVTAAALVFVSAAWALRFTDESYATPVGAVGSPYSFTFTGAGGCGPALPYQYSLIGGSLPPGLSLAKSGRVSGTPAQAGGWSFWVNLSDENPPSASWCVPGSAQREFTITINGPGGSPAPGPSPAPTPTPALSITTSGLPAATVGSAYSTTLSASGSATKTWTVAAGSLPAGLSLSANGLVSGTPSAPGTASFTANVSAGGANSQRQFSLEVTAALQISAVATQVAEVAVPLTIELNASGGSAPYRWELTQGALPMHVGFIGDQGNGSKALIKGVPADAGSFSLTFRVTDVLGRSTLHTITLGVADKLRLTAVKMPRFGRVGKLYQAHGVAEDGYGKRTWSVTRGVLPAGLQLNSKTGFITGKPARRGRYAFYLTTKDELGASRSMKITLVIR
jgi:putative Ig domain-containing protein